MPAHATLQVLLVLLVLAISSSPGRALQSGQSRPSGYSEDEVSRAIRTFVLPGTADYRNLVVLNTTSAMVVDGAPGTMLATKRLADKLLVLASDVQRLLSPDLRLRVQSAFVPYPQPTERGNTSLHYEGRAADIALAGPNATALNMQALGDLAVDAGFDFVSFATSTHIHVSVIPDDCQSAIDLVFLVDGSGSVEAANFNKALAFIKDVVSYFDIGPTQTRVSVVTFSGFLGFESTISGLPDCPPGTQFELSGYGCICAPGGSCSGPTATSLADAGCLTGHLSSGEIVELYTHSCTACSCSPDKTWGGGPSAQTNFLLNQYSTKAEVLSAIDAIPYPDGATHTSVGLQHVNTEVLQTAAGARPPEDGVPRIVVVITDGQANTGYEPAQAALDLRNANANIFAIGVAFYSLFELRQIANSPDQVFTLDSFDDIFELTGRMASGSCDKPALVTPGDTTDTTLPRNSFKYFQPSCSQLPNTIVVTVADITGASAVYISFTQPNPGPLDYDLKDESSNPVKSIQVVRPSSSAPVYVSVLGTEEDNRFTLNIFGELFIVSPAPAPGSPYSIDKTLAENTPVGTVVVPVLALADLGSYTPTLTFSIALGNEDNTFAVDPSTGVVTLAKALDFESVRQHVFTLRGQDTALPCLSGEVVVRLNVSDSNDHHPIFAQLVYTVTVPETLAVGADLLKVTATDADPVPANTISYAIVEPAAAALFQIDAASGRITLKSALDYETAPSHNFTVSARDAGSPPLSAEPAARVTVFVLDRLDQPPVFAPDVYSIILSAAAPPDRSLPVLQLTATDADADDSFAFSLSPPDALPGFQLDAATGELFALSSLNLDPPRLLTATAAVTDLVGMSDTASISIEIVSGNQPPTNIRLEPSTVPESAAVGTVVGVLRADDNPAQTVSFRLLDSAGGRFRLAGSSLLLEQALDFEAFPSHVIQVNATDNGSPPLSATALLTVQVLPVNEAPVSITLSNANVAENRAVPATVGQLAARDLDTANNLTFALDDSAFGRFQLGGPTTCTAVPTGGVTCTTLLQTAQVLDFEARASWEVGVVVRDQALLSKRADFTIAVLDSNDAPTLLLLQGASVVENAPPGTLIGRFSTRDQDSGQTFTYTLTNSAGGRFAVANGSQLVVAEGARGNLDHEATPTLTISALSTDSGTPPLSVSGTFTIAVLDANEPPRFSRPNYTVAVNVPAAPSPASFVTRVQATDPDVGDAVTYSWACMARQGDAGDPQRVNDYFALATNTGDISSIAFAEYPATLGGFCCNYTATDRAGLHSTVPLCINLVRPNRPPSGLTLAPATVPEDAPLDAVVGVLVGVDPDDQALTYTLQLEAGTTAPPPFRVGSDGGDDANRLLVAGPLDFETRSAYSLNVVVRDPEGLTGTFGVAVTVEDVNEAPNFTQPVYNFAVDEGATQGQQIGAAICTDPDGGVFGQLRYSLLTAGSARPEAIAIDPTSGMLSVVRQRILPSSGELELVPPLDHEATPVLSMKVVCTDTGDLGSEALVVITVRNVNEPPTFASAAFTAEIAENQPAGTFVLAVPATDPDAADAGGGLVYSLEAVAAALRPAVAERFAVAAPSGNITTLMPLDYEGSAAGTSATFVMTVRATDGSGLAANAEVTVAVRDVNEPPVFPLSEYVLLVSEAAPTSSLVATVTAEDEDGGVWGQLSYAWSCTPAAPAAALFELVAGTGQIRVRAALNFESVNLFRCMLTATDGGGLSATTLVVLNVTNANDKPASIALSGPLAVPENSAPGTLVGVLSAVDVDAGQTLSFSLVDNAGGRFVLGGAAGNEVLVGVGASLDFEVQSSYTIEVRGEDSGTPPLALVQAFTIGLINVNEPPAFTSAVYALQVAENASVGVVVGEVQAQDPDALGGGGGGAGAWNALVYSVAGGDGQSMFAVDAASGRITLAQPLDFESQSSFLLLVACVDGGGLRASPNASVRISVSNINDAGPVFAGPYTIKMWREQPVGSHVVRIEAADPDGGVRFSLPGGGNEYGLFAIDAETGLVTTLEVPSRAKLVAGGGGGRRRRRAGWGGGGSGALLVGLEVAARGRRSLPESLDLNAPIRLVVQAVDKDGLASTETVNVTLYDGCTPSPCLIGYACAAVWSADTWSECTPGVEYQARPGNFQQDRLCMPCSTCGRDAYAVGGCDGLVDTVCAPRSPCSSSEFEVLPTEAGRDRVCQSCAVCGPGQVQTRPCTAVANTVCAPVGSGALAAPCGRGEFFSVATGSCEPCSTCGAGTYAVPGSCVLTNNTECRPVTECIPGLEFARNAPTASADRVCQTCTICPGGVLEDAPCTTSSNRQCSYLPLPSCECKPGFEGPTCETNTDDCVGVVCSNGGSCVDLVDGYECRCANNFTGPSCRIDLKVCPPFVENPCVHGICGSVEYGMVCSCETGYNGTLCEEPCEGGKKGEACQEDVADDCSDNPCRNGGTCTPGSGGAGVTCACVEPFTGDYCENNKTACVVGAAGEPCANGGLCLPRFDGFDCSCGVDFTGARCETPVAAGSGGQNKTIVLNSEAGSGGFLWWPIVLALALLLCCLLAIVAWRRHTKDERQETAKLDSSGLPPGAVNTYKNPLWVRPTDGGMITDEEYDSLRQAGQAVSAGGGSSVQPFSVSTDAALLSSSLTSSAAAQGQRATIHGAGGLAGGLATAGRSNPGGVGNPGFGELGASEATYAAIGSRQGSGYAKCGPRGNEYEAASALEQAGGGVPIEGVGNAGYGLMEPAVGGGGISRNRTGSVGNPLYALAGSGGGGGGGGSEYLEPVYASASASAMQRKGSVSNPMYDVARGTANETDTDGSGYLDVAAAPEDNSGELTFVPGSAIYDTAQAGDGTVVFEPAYDTASMAMVGSGGTAAQRQRQRGASQSSVHENPLFRSPEAIDWGEVEPRFERNPSGYGTILSRPQTGERRIDDPVYATARPGMAEGLYDRARTGSIREGEGAYELAGGGLEAQGAEGAYELAGGVQVLRAEGAYQLASGLEPHAAESPYELAAGTAGAVPYVIENPYEFADKEC